MLLIDRPTTPSLCSVSLKGFFEWRGAIQTLEGLFVLTKHPPRALTRRLRLYKETWISSGVVILLAPIQRHRLEKKSDRWKISCSPIGRCRGGLIVGWNPLCCALGMTMTHFSKMWIWLLSAPAQPPPPLRVQTTIIHLSLTQPLVAGVAVWPKVGSKWE